jgi:hypothetical protein
MNTKEEMDLTVADNEESKWMEQVQDYVYWKAFKLTVLNLTVLLPGH